MHKDGSSVLHAGKQWKQLVWVWLQNETGAHLCYSGGWSCADSSMPVLLWLPTCLLCRFINTCLAFIARLSLVQVHQCLSCFDCQGNLSRFIHACLALILKSACADWSMPVFLWLPSQLLCRLINACLTLIAKSTLEQIDQCLSCFDCQVNSCADSSVPVLLWLPSQLLSRLINACLALIAKSTLVQIHQCLSLIGIACTNFMLHGWYGSSILWWSYIREKKNVCRSLRVSE